MQKAPWAFAGMVVCLLLAVGGLVRRALPPSAAPDTRLPPPPISTLPPVPANTPNLYPPPAPEPPPDDPSTYRPGGFLAPIPKGMTQAEAYREGYGSLQEFTPEQRAMIKERRRVAREWERARQEGRAPKRPAGWSGP